MKPTERQKELLRHALGLPSPSKRSFRNRFVAGKKHASYADWQNMVVNGLATKQEGKSLPFGGSDCFYASYRGAQTALKKGETLCPEDFPEQYPAGHAALKGGDA